MIKGLIQKSTLFLAFSMLAVVVIFGVNAKLTKAENVTVNMNDSGFEPGKIEIQQGDTVEFKNLTKDFRWPASNLHPTHDIYPEFDPLQGVEPGKSWSFRFGKSGTWKYHDHLLPQFSGTVIVKGGPNSQVSSEQANTGEKISKNFFAKIWEWIKNLWPWGDNKKANANNDTANKEKGIDNKKSGEINLSKYNREVTKSDDKIFTDDTLLGSHLKNYGVKDTVTQLRLLETRFGSCHQPAHRAGHIGYKMFGDKAFVEYSAECQSGYYHGVMEAYFKEHGAENIKDSLANLCRGGLNSFFEHQCIHGIGHGLEAWANYELPDALAACDELPKRQDSCWTGVFMENLAAKISQPGNAGGKPKDVGSTDVHVTKYLKDDDALYPCNWVEDKYKGSCYFLQTSRMLQIFGQDFQKIAEACSTAPAMYQNSCFGSMGRDVGGNFPKDAAREIKECSYVTVSAQMKIECLNGAVQNGFWDPSGQDFAIGFCKLLTDVNEKSACYTTIINRVPEIMFEATAKQSFCAKMETQFQPQCKQITGTGI